MTEFFIEPSRRSSSISLHGLPQRPPDRLCSIRQMMRKNDISERWTKTKECALGHHPSPLTVVTGVAVREDNKNRNKGGWHVWGGSNNKKLPIRSNYRVARRRTAIQRIQRTLSRTTGDNILPPSTYISPAMMGQFSPETAMTRTHSSARAQQSTFA